MSISELAKVVTPPASPVEAENDGAWERAQHSINTELPNDFQEFALCFGSGTFCRGLAVINPLSDDFERPVNYLLETLRDVVSWRNYPYQVFPDKPGLLPWGSNDNGVIFYWLTQGDADTWPVVIESHDGDLERFDMSMTTFLAKSLSNEIRPTHIWSRPFTQDELIFVPQS